MTERLAGRYLLLRRIGRGGMGEVFLARDLTNGGECAVKRLAGRAVEGGAVALRREFEALTRLRHPAIVGVREFGVEPDGDPYLVLDYVPGVPADRVVARGDWRSACEIAAEVAHGLEALHAAGVVHGDLKPSNVLIVGGSDSPGAIASVQLLDFGLASLLDGRPEAHRGTPGYAAPEVVEGSRPTTASDLYGLGATLFTLIAGRPPFDGDDAGAMLRAQREGPPSPRWLAGAAAPAPLVELVLAMLAAEPGERPESARSARLELERIHPGARRGLSERLRAAIVVGRERELARVESWIARAPRSQRIAFVAGERGIGKSTLLGELAARATLAGRASLALSCAGFEGRGPLARAVARVLFDRLPKDRRAQGEDALRLLLDPGSRLTDTNLGPLVESTARWAAEAIKGSGLVIVLDDAEHLDAWSSAWLRRLALHPADVPLRWILASGNEERSENRALIETGHALRISLGPLPGADIEGLVAARLHSPPPPELLEFLARTAGGHPGSTVELLHAAARTGALSETETGLRVDRPALERVSSERDGEEGFARRLEAIDDGARRTLEALALCGGALGLDALRKIAPGTDARTLVALATAGFAVHVSDGTCTLRPSPLTEYVVRSLSPERREALHRAALSIETLSAAERFRHARAIGARPEALEAAERAFGAEPESRLAAEAAVLAEAESPELAARWHERAALALRSRGRYAEAVPHLERALELETRGERRSERWVTLSTATLRAGAPGGVLEVVRRACEEEIGESALARLLVNRGAARLALGERAAASADAHEALALADRSKEPGAQGPAAELLAWQHLENHDLDRAEAFAARAAEAWAAARDSYGRVRAIGLQAAVARARFRLDDAERRLRESVAAARGIENRLALSEQLLALSSLLVEAGRWSAALEPASEAARIELEDGRSGEAAGALAQLAQLDGLLGRGRRSRRRALAAVRLCRQLRPAQISYALRSAAQAERVLGRPSGAERIARLALAHAARGRADDPAWCRLEVARACAAREDWAGAEQACRSEEGGGDETRSIAGALREAWIGRARLRARDADAAREKLRVVSEWLESNPAPYVAAYAQLLQAECAFFEQRSSDAIEIGRRALGALGALPAPAERARAALDLARLAPDTPGHSEAVVEWLDLAAHGFERAGDRRGREEALALAVEWLKRPARTATSARESGLIDRVSWLLHSLTDFAELTRRAMRAAVEQFDAERGVLLLVDPESGQLAPVAEHGAVEAAMRSEAMSYSRRVVRRVTESGGSLVIHDAPTDPRAASKSVADLGLRSILCVPLFLSGRTVGAVYLDDSRRTHAFGDMERSVLEGFAQLMAVAIEKSRRHEEVRRENELLEGENRSLRAEIGKRTLSEGVIGTSEPIQKVMALVEHAARTNTTVLITGENGTGKELVARTLHHLGKRQLGPFVAVNCGAIPASLLESELFGILANIATGVRERAGRFVQADGGTLFLDEVGEMPLSQQVALLSAIANREITPVGGGRPIPIDVRIIAATNRDLRQLVDQKLFREDLFYRLNVIELEMPALRERKGDIPALVQHFVRHFARQFERDAVELSADFLAVVMRSDWPGNVRELQNYIERVMAMTSGSVLRPDPPPRDLERGQEGPRGPSRPLGDVVEETERRMIRAALERAGGNQSSAARSLGITEQALRYRLRRYKIERSRVIRRVRQKSRADG